MARRAGTSVTLTENDLHYVWAPAYGLVHGVSGSHFYGRGVAGVSLYPPPFEVALAPLGLLSLDAAHVVTLPLTALLVMGSVLAWSRAPDGYPRWVAPLILSAPVVAVVLVNNLMSALGLAALTVAIFAQRQNRWLIVGIASAVALERTINAVPVVAMLAIGAWGQPRHLARALVGGLLVIVPLGLAAFAWDPRWPQDYVATTSQFHYVGPIELARAGFGLGGAIALVGGLTAAGVLLALPRRGRGVDLDRVALVLALTVVISDIAGAYAAVFALPAVARLAARPGMSLVAWSFAFIPWLVKMVSIPALLGADPQGAFNRSALLWVILPLTLLVLIRRQQMPGEGTSLG